MAAALGNVDWKLSYMIMYVHLQEQSWLVSRRELNLCTVLMTPESSTSINHILVNIVEVITWGHTQITVSQCTCLTLRPPHRLQFPLQLCVFCKCIYKKGPSGPAILNTLQEHSCQLVAHESTVHNSIQSNNQHWHYCPTQEILSSLRLSELLHVLVLPGCNPKIHTLL